MERVQGREWNPSTTGQTAALQPFSRHGAVESALCWTRTSVWGSSTAALIFEMVENLPSFELAGKQDVHKENARHTDKAPKQGVFGDGQSVAEREFKDVGHREEGSVA